MRQQSALSITRRRETGKVAVLFCSRTRITTTIIKIIVIIISIIITTVIYAGREVRWVGHLSAEFVV